MRRRRYAVYLSALLTYMIAYAILPPAKVSRVKLRERKQAQYPYFNRSWKLSKKFLSIRPIRSGPKLFGLTQSES